MAGGKFSEALLYGMTVRESATDGSDFTNPAADYRRLFLGEDGQLHVKDSAGAVTDIGAGSGAVATDAIWDAAGDLAVGSGANTAARLAIGATNGMALRRVGGAVAWAFPPGHELAYVERTTSLSVTATSEGTGQTVVSAGAVTFDGSTRVCIEFYCPQVSITVGQELILDLSDGGTEIGRLAELEDLARTSVHVRRFITPSAASHTYDIQAWKTGGTASLDPGAGGTGARMPAFIRITVA